MATLGFLHTSPVHVETFDALVAGAGPGEQALHLVDEGALAQARADGPESVRERIRGDLVELVTMGADAICCTCSTIGDVAESLDLHGVVVCRVDRPMAADAVRVGRRIGLVVALDSTVEPSRSLIVDEGRVASLEVVVEVVVVDGAWRAFEAGDSATYLSLVVSACRDLAPGVDVIVLGQASMATAVEKVGDLDVPVLASPARAVEWMLRHA